MKHGVNREVMKTVEMFIGTMLPRLQSVANNSKNGDELETKQNFNNKNKANLFAIDTNPNPNAKAKGKAGKSGSNKITINRNKIVPKTPPPPDSSPGDSDRSKKREEIKEMAKRRGSVTIYRRPSLPSDEIIANLAEMARTHGNGTPGHYGALSGLKLDLSIDDMANISVNERKQKEIDNCNKSNEKKVSTIATGVNNKNKNALGGISITRNKLNPITPTITRNYVSRSTSPQPADDEKNKGSKTQETGVAKTVDLSHEKHNNNNNNEDIGSDENENETFSLAMNDKLTISKPIAANRTQEMERKDENESKKNTNNDKHGSNHFHRHSDIIYSGNNIFVESDEKMIGNYINRSKHLKPARIINSSLAKGDVVGLSRDIVQYPLELSGPCFLYFRVFFCYVFLFCKKISVHVRLQMCCFLFCFVLYFNYKNNSPVWMESFEVMTHEMSLCETHMNSLLAKGIDVSDDLIDRLESLKVNRVALECEALTGMLKVEEYTQRLKQCMKVDLVLAKYLKKQDRKQEAARVWQRFKIMRAEIYGSKHVPQTQKNW